jgi:dihydrofolate synthase / folylpolyglutamate synthase
VNGGKVGGASVPRLSYQEALAWLYGTQRFGIKLGLENIRKLLRELRLPRGNPRIVHVAGTNGKGSVCAMIDSICRAQGYRTGLFTSPHLITFRERIRVSGEMISEECVASGLTEIRDSIMNWEPYPTFFEIATALGLLHFAEKSAEIIVLETGMGGRLDATNAMQSVVSVITPIDLDHQKWLGETIGDIASEKAGIIKPRMPVISASQLPEAEKVIRSRATECDAPLQFIPNSYRASAIGLVGAHQTQNAAVAIAAIRAARIEIDDAAIIHGLASVEWPARFQVWDERTIIDGAHNPAGASALAQTWREKFGVERATIILAILSDKDAARIVRELIPIATRFLLPRIRSERALPPNELMSLVLASDGETPSTSTHESFSEALNRARNYTGQILITGSLHFAGEALAELRGVPAAFEECTQ